MSVLFRTPVNNMGFSPFGNMPVPQMGQEGDSGSINYNSSDRQQHGMYLAHYVWIKSE
jgi:hypothetical protein